MMAVWMFGLFGLMRVKSGMKTLPYHLKSKQLPFDIVGEEGGSIASYGISYYYVNKKYVQVAKKNSDKRHTQ